MQCETPVVCKHFSLPEVGGNVRRFMLIHIIVQMAQVIAKVISLNSADRKAQRAKMQVNLKVFLGETAEQTVAVYKKCLEFDLQ